MGDKEEKNRSAQQLSKNIPDDVLSVLESSDIGYLSVTSSKGELFSYPVAFYFSRFKVYFMTPISAAKLKFVRANPTVSFLVDNRLLTKGACGVMIQGKARVFSIAKTVLNILSLGPKMVHFAKKYPGMFTFYASGKDLPDERKLHKYRLIRIDPTKVLYWQGYQFGRYTVGDLDHDPLSEVSDEAKMETFARLLGTADEELPVREVPQTQEWIGGLNAATKRGDISEEERAVIDSYRSFLRIGAFSSKVGAEVSDEEKKLLRKWRKGSTAAYS